MTKESIAKLNTINQRLRTTAVNESHLFTSQNNWSWHTRLKKSAEKEGQLRMFTPLKNSKQGVKYL